MEIIIAFIIGAAAGAAAYHYLRKRQADKASEPGVTIQGGGGPGEEGP